MRLVLFFLLFVLILPLRIVFAQDTGNLRGFVTDSTNSEALPYCNVYVDELKTGASTDANGYFLINSVPANKELTLIISYVGYATKKMQFRVKPGKIYQLAIKLSPINLELQVIEKVGERFVGKNSTDIGMQKLTLRNLEFLPKGVEIDIFRTLQYIPGVLSTSDISSRYYVRGGSSDQNLVLLNGVTVYNPFHALGLFSVIDPEMINSVEFFKGGFTAENFGRLSSILRVTSKDGNKNKYGVKASSSYMTGKLLIEGPTPSGSFMFTGRKSYSSQILKKFLKNDNIPIDFYDFSFKVNYSNPEILDNGKFILFGFLSKDNIDYENELKENFTWSNNLIGANWLQIYDAPVFSEMSVSLSNYSGEIIPNLANVKPRKNEVSDFSVKMDLSYVQQNKDQLDLGVHFKAVSTRLLTVNPVGAKTDYDKFGGNFSVFAKYKLLRFENFGIDVGSRLNLSGISNNGSFFFEPRVSLSYVPIPVIAFKAAWGIYQQELVTITDEDEVITLFEPWMIVPDYLTPPRSIHYVGGTDIYFTEDIKLKVETYLKKVFNLAIINKDKVLNTEPDLVSGNGQSSGVEVSLSYSTIPLNINLSYSLSYSYKELNNTIYYPKYDTRHSGNISVEWSLPFDFTVNCVWIFASGLPFTQLVGYYDKYYISNLFEPYLNAGYYKPFLLLGDKNLGRLPYYHRLDFSISKKFQFSFVKASLDFSILNVYDRKNIFYFKRDTGDRVNMLPFLPTATLKVEL
ncbi:MAG: carboxypeptidase-like regulatory domain-containing protein [Ignavibacteriaceae bacterium]